MRPVSVGGSRTGKVTSITLTLGADATSETGRAAPSSAHLAISEMPVSSPLTGMVVTSMCVTKSSGPSSDARRRSLSWCLRAAIASVTRSLISLIAAPAPFRCSGGSLPTIRAVVVIDPLLPSVLTRIASSAASSAAAATSAMILAASIVSVISSSLGWFWGPGEEKIKPCRARSLCSVATCGPREEREGGSSGRERGLGLTDDGFERRRLANGEVGQHLAIDRDPGLAEAVDKSTVGEPERSHRGIEALDPQRAEGALFALAVAIGVLVGALDRLLGDADGVLAPAVVALRGLADFLVAGVGGDAALDPSHGRSPSGLSNA